MKKSTKLFLLPLVALMITGCKKTPEEVLPTVQLDNANLTLVIGGTKALVATSENGEGSVAWSSSDESVATISAEGVVTAVGVGDATITATYAGVTATCKITVVASEHYRLAAVQENENIKEFKLNVADEDEEFRGETSAVIEVGDDNAFDVKPTLKIMDKETLQYVDESAWPFQYSYKLLVKNAGEYVAADAADVESFDAAKCKIDFAASAIGKEFKLTVVPGGLSAAQQVDPEYAKTVELKVSDGWNVYSENELAYFDDINMHVLGDFRQGGCLYSQADRDAAWVAFRTAKGLSTDYVAPGIFLQKNLNLGRENIPDLFFYADSTETGGVEEAVGSMKDSTDVYMRQANGFVFNGNYFNIDTNNVPLGYGPLMYNPSDNITHSTLFKAVEWRDSNNPEYAGELTSAVTFKNCSYFGNAPRSNDIKYRAGLIFIKVKAPTYSSHVTHVLFDNFNVTRSAISFYVEYGLTDTIIKDCYVADDYANGIYAHINGDFHFVNSVLENMGGPIIVTNCNDSTQVGVHIEADAATVFNNYIAGTEPWFVNTGANNAIPTIFSLDGYCFTQSQLTFLKTIQDENGDPLQVANMILANRGDTDLVSFKKGEGERVGIDKNTDGYATILGTVQAATPYPWVFGDNGHNEMFQGPIGNVFGGSSYTQMMMYNSMFGHIAVIFELFSTAA